MKVWSFIPPELVFQGGLPNEAVIGFWDAEPDSVLDFRENPAFVELMHAVIAKAGPTDPRLRAAAEEQQAGHIYVIDLRTPDGPQGEVPPVDVVGGWVVDGGVIVPGSYQANPNHRLMTRDGESRLPPPLQQALVDELIRLTRERKGDPPAT